MTEHPIPEDLQGRYIELTRWDKGPLNGMQMPWQCSLRDEANLIERSAALEAENAQLRNALEGLLARHCDGSDEWHWAEWDTAKEALEQK